MSPSLCLLTARALGKERGAGQVLAYPPGGDKGTKSAADARSALGLATVAASGSYNDLSNKPSLATVATSGSYNDLANKPNIPQSLTVDSAVTATGANPVSGKAVADYAQPKVTSGTDDLTAGSSALATGEVYLVYE